MNIELIREKFLRDERVFCEKCKSEIKILGNIKTGVITSAQCSKNPNHYSVILNKGKSIAEMFPNVPQKIAA